ncbi:OLC1v1037527C1 [Oldenlandia corymbosa var. corymbosa]|uniref:OLC1v1037527C1 n=1 Tax=Oldenlandia corymbosa var. corymbosa TaxID=529605 RepID=A0AAV1E4K8_OLDCO|nr:OLC1v1037527C1 [Oldenlandia corymbosa var. corymbosa]
MARYEENSRLRTLADAVSGPFESDLGVGGNGVLPSGPGVNGFNVKEEGDGGSDGGGGAGGGDAGAGGMERNLGVSDGPVVDTFDEVNEEVEAAKVLSGNGLSAGQNGIIEEMAVVNEEGEDGVGEDDNGEHGFSVGDLVWGKIRSHPWWPGQIYDPKDASENALKLKHKGRLLVAYFGDGSFAWCSPSQLIPFAEHFEEMSKQSTSKIFAIAVQEAVDEIGRLVDMEMTCKCVTEENRKGLDSPLSKNAGIRAEVQLPEGDIGKLLSFRYESAELLATVASAAETISFANMLDLAILKGWLSAFFRSKGAGYSLPVYREGQLIEGLEDKNRLHKIGLIKSTGVPLKGPLEQDWSSAAVSGSDSGLLPSGDKVYHSRKEKSVAELLGKGLDVKLKNMKKKITVADGTGNQSDGSCAPSAGRKRGRSKTDKMLQLGESSGECKVGETGGADREDAQGSKDAEGISSPRERKRSKYLSPPYTNAQIKAVKLSFKKELENESVEISEVAKTGEHAGEVPEQLSSKKDSENGSVRVSKTAAGMGERMTKVSAILLDSPLVHCNGQIVKEKTAKIVNGTGQLGSSVDIYPARSQQEQEITVTMDADVTPSAVLGGVLHVAVSPLHSWDESLLVILRGFLSTFRNSISTNGAKHRGRQRKSSNPAEQGGVENGDAKSTEAKKRRSGSKKANLDNLDTRKPKKAAKSSVVKLNEKKVQGKASPFPPTPVASGDDTSFPFLDKQVVSESAADKGQPLGLQSQQLMMIATMLEKCDRKVSPEEVSGIDGGIKNLYDIVRKITEAAS